MASPISTSATMQPAWSSPVQTQAVSAQGTVDTCPRHGCFILPALSGTGRFLLDLCSGATRPLSQAAFRNEIACFRVDILLGSSHDLLQDVFYESMLRWCFTGLFLFALAGRLVAISVELSFALEVLSRSRLRSSLLGFRACQDVISSALKPVALFFNAFRFCLLFSVQADMSALSSLRRHFLGRILLCKIFLRKRQRFAVWCLPAPSV